MGNKIYNTCPDTFPSEKDVPTLKVSSAALQVISLTNGRLTFQEICPFSLYLVPSVIWQNQNIELYVSLIYQTFVSSLAENSFVNYCKQQLTLSYSKLNIMILIVKRNLFKNGFFFWRKWKCRRITFAD